MDTATDADLTRAVFDREVRLVEGAIRMVALGGSQWLICGGLRFGERVLELVAGPAAAQGVDVEPMWRSDEEGCDLRVQKAHG